ncbi:hypothetical protein PLESTF_001544200, partial [Pleodorina starrii]
MCPHPFRPPCLIGTALDEPIEAGAPAAVLQTVRPLYDRRSLSLAAAKSKTRRPPVAPSTSSSSSSFIIVIIVIIVVIVARVVHAAHKVLVTGVSASAFQ